MHFHALLPLVSAVVGALVAILAFRFAEAPGWGHFRVLALMALTGAFYLACETFVGLEVSDSLYLAVMRLQGPGACAWAGLSLLYDKRHAKEPLGAFDKGMLSVLAIAAPLWLFPGVLYTDVVTKFEVAGLRYSNVTPTNLGAFVQFLEVVGVMVSFARRIRAWLGGDKDARILAISNGLLFLTAFNDIAVPNHVYDFPFLLPVGFLSSVTAIGIVVTRSFVANARALEEIRQDLEKTIVRRTEALVAAETALVRVEKQAMIGRLAVGVAHEINNPAAALRGNLEYIELAVRNAGLPDDIASSIDDSVESIDRITEIVRRLLELGASNEGADARPALSAVLEAAHAEKRKRA